MKQCSLCREILTGEQYENDEITQVIMYESPYDVHIKCLDEFPEETRNEMILKNNLRNKRQEIDKKGKEILKVIFPSPKSRSESIWDSILDNLFNNLPLSEREKDFIKGIPLERRDKTWIKRLHEEQEKDKVFRLPTTGLPAVREHPYSWFATDQLVRRGDHLVLDQENYKVKVKRAHAFNGLWKSATESVGSSGEQE